jgi:hypothetical protein
MRRLLAASAVAASLALVAAAPALAVVLVNAPEPSVACGKPIKTGVWYQSFSGGPKTAKITIRSTGGTVLKSRSVVAGNSWHYWNYFMPCGHTYKVRYVTASGTSNFTVRVR